MPITKGHNSSLALTESVIDSPFPSLSKWGYVCFYVLKPGVAYSSLSKTEHVSQTLAIFKFC
jgi:hypothetical protein